MESLGRRCPPSESTVSIFHPPRPPAPRSRRRRSRGLFLLTIASRIPLWRANLCSSCALPPRLLLIIFAANRRTLTRLPRGIFSLKTTRRYLSIPRVLACGDIANLCGPSKRRTKNVLIRKKREKLRLQRLCFLESYFRQLRVTASGRLRFRRPLSCGGSATCGIENRRLSTSFVSRKLSHEFVDDLEEDSFPSLRSDIDFRGGEFCSEFRPRLRSSTDSSSGDSNNGEFTRGQ